MNDEIQSEEQNSPIVKNPEFWKFPINNFDYLLDTVYKKINILHRELPYGFDPKKYVSLHPDLIQAGVEGTKHYLRYGRKEQRRYR